MKNVNGLGRKNRSIAKSGSIGFVQTGNYMKDNMQSVSPLQVQPQTSEGIQVQPYNDGEAQEGKRTSSVSHPKSRQTISKSSTMQEKNVQNEEELKNLNTASKQLQGQGSELAKIQPTAAHRIAHDKLVQQNDAQQRTELVTQFVDFSSKYGLGYKLSNGSYGVLFNDSTKIITHPNLFHFDYVEKSRNGGESATSNTQNTDTMNDQVQQYNFFDYPESINKKVVLLQHFKSYLDGN